MFGSPYLVFASIFVVVLMFEYDFLARDHLHCDVSPEDKPYTELFCMARTRNLITNAEGAHLKNYGRWQFFIIIQMFITAISCRIDLKIRELKSDAKPNIGKRYVLTVCIMINILVCWFFTLWCMGGYFNTYISRVLYHAVDRRSVVSPLDDVFPMSANCFVEFRNGSEPFTTTCKLPLHATAPYYFIALFAVYVMGLLWSLERILHLAKEKIAETRARRRAMDVSSAEEGQDIMITLPREDLSCQERRAKDTLYAKVSAKFLQKFKNLASYSHLRSADPKMTPLI